MTKARYRVQRFSTNKKQRIRENHRDVHASFEVVRKELHFAYSLDA